MRNKYKFLMKLSKIRNMPQWKKQMLRFKVTLKNLRKKTNIYGTQPYKLHNNNSMKKELTNL